MECITSVGLTVLDPETKELSDAERLPMKGINSPELEGMMKSCITFSDASEMLKSYKAQAYIKSESLCYYPTEKGSLLFIKYMGKEEEKITVNTEIPGPVLDQLAAAADEREIKEILAANNINYDKDVDRTVTRDERLEEEELSETRVDGNIKQTREMDSDERAKRAPEGYDKYGYDRRREEERMRDGMDR